MKIKEIKVIVCSPGRNFTTVKVITDEGIYGVGDATVNGRELSVASYLEDHVAPTLIGKDPLRTEDIWQYLYKGAYWRRGPVTMATSRVPSSRGTATPGVAAGTGGRGVPPSTWRCGTSRPRPPTCRSTSCSAAGRATR